MFNNLPAISLLCISFFFALSVAAQDNSSESLVLAQIHILPGSDWNQIASEIDHLKAAGFNGIIFRAFHNSGDRYHDIAGLEPDQKPTGVYFSTELAPTLIDVLGPLAEICRKRKVKIYAWMTTRTMDWIDIPSSRDKRYDERSGELVESKQFDLFNNTFKRYLIDILSDIAREDVDGIILQDDFTIKTREGFTDEGLKLFKSRSGLNLDPASVFKVVRTASGTVYLIPQGTLFRQWAVFKSDYLAEFGADLVSACKSVNSELEIGWNVYYDTALSPEEGLLWLSQEWMSLEKLPFDRILFMAYHRQAAEELGWSVTEAIAALGLKAAELSHRLGDRLVIKFQVRDWQTRSLVPPAEIESLANAFSHIGANKALVPVGGNEKELQRLFPLLRNVETAKGGNQRR